MSILSIENFVVRIQATHCYLIILIEVSYYQSKIFKYCPKQIEFNFKDIFKTLATKHLSGASSPTCKNCNKDMKEKRKRIHR